MDRILLLGDPGLRVVSAPVADFGSVALRSEEARLERVLERFRARHGFGRAISAPQVGITRRMIAMNLGEGPFLLVNPRMPTMSAEKFTLWDDCMSFPWLMVRLSRHRSVDLEFEDTEGRTQRWRNVEAAVSELVQHEIDHLDGILAVDRALDGHSLIAHDLYLERKGFFDSQVDYSISPT